MTAYLSGKDLAALAAFSRKVVDGECINAQELRLQALIWLQDIFGNHAGNFFLCDTVTIADIVGSYTTHGLPRETESSYPEYYYCFDPVLNHYQHEYFLRSQSPSISVTSLTEFVPTTKLYDSEYGYDFLKPMKIYHQLNAVFQVTDSLTANLVVFRPPSKTAFDDADYLVIEIISSLMKSSLQSIIHRDGVLKTRAAAESLAAQFSGQGVLVLDENLEVIFANNQARRLLGQVILVSGPREICPSVLSQIGAMYSTLDPNETTSVNFELTRPDGSEVLPARLHSTRLDGDRLLLVTLGNLKPSDTWLRFARSHGVSRREIEVIASVIEGRTNQETARNLFISEHTVENHLKSIYKKLGVNSRTRLMRVLLKKRHS